MRYLLQFLTRWFRKKPMPWTRETPWRQGSVVPSSHAVNLGLVAEHHSPEKFAIVISHDCDLANDIEDEPDVEIIVGTSIEACLPDKTHAKNVRILHIEIDGPGGRQAVELVARKKVPIPKSKMVGFGPDKAYSIAAEELGTLRSWLAARYKRASIPDGLQNLIKDIFHDIAKKKERPRALRGIWIDFDPDVEHLPSGEKYELWIVVVYSTSEEGSKAVAEDAIKQIKDKFERKYRKGGVWTGLDLRECVARSDTEFTYYDTHRYKLFRLEYLSLRTGSPGETGNE
jgi:hypothetical protein